MKKVNSDTVIGIMFIPVIILTVIFGIHACVQDVKTTKKYGEIKYEYIITEKYEDFGSNWHLVGGRATETEYHVVYKYRVINRPDRDDNLVWYKDETTVSGSRYRELQIGQNLYGYSSIFPY